jgi:ligand-binding SRPBCC domain-containing protein
MNPPGHRFHHSSQFDATVEDLWSFHMRPDALTTLSPPMSGFVVTDPGEGVRNNSVLRARVGFWPFRHRWVALHTDVERLTSFTDTALESPFRHWVHLHSFTRMEGGRSRLTDSVWFVPPRWLPGRLGEIVVAGVLRILFSWRHRVTRRALRQKNDYGRWPEECRPRPKRTSWRLT